MYLFIFCPLLFGEDLLLHGKIQGPLDPEHPVIVLILWKPPQRLFHICILINCVIAHQTCQEKTRNAKDADLKFNDTTVYIQSGL